MDLSDRAVSIKEGEDLAAQNNVLFIETSAKVYRNIEKVSSYVEETKFVRYLLHWSKQ